MSAAESNSEEKREAVPDRRDRSPIILILTAILLLVVLTNIALVYGYLVQPVHLRFMGIIAGVRDSNIYFMMMTQGDGWSPVLENLFRPGEPNAIYHGFFWFFLGKLSRVLGISSLAVFHAARVFATILFVPAIYFFSGRFVHERVERLCAATVISFGAGAGWIMVLLHRFSGHLAFVPSDIGTPEASSFYTLMTFPHLSFTLIFVFLSMMYVWDAIDSGGIRPAILAGICGLLVGFIHAFNLIVVCLALALFLAASMLIKRDRSPVTAIVVVAFFSVWPIAYYTFITLAKPGLLPVGAVRSPTPFAYLVGFGPLVLGSLVRIVFLWRSRELPRSDLFLFCWIISTALLLYSYPVLSQEARAVLGLQIPLTILAVRAVFSDILPALGAAWQEEGWERRKAFSVIIVASFVVLTLPSTVYNIIDRSSRLRNYSELFSLTADQHEALVHLSGVGGRDIVLAGERAGIYVPRVADKRTWMGQYNYPSYSRRMTEIREFYGDFTPDSQRFEFLRDNGIRFVFHGEQEKSFGDFRPDRADYLEPVFRNASATVYEVEIEGETIYKN